MLAVMVVSVTGCATQNGGGSSVVSTPSAASPLNTAGRGAAMWTFSKGFSPTPTSTELKVEVHWRGCAGGAAVEDPKPELSYSASQVTLTIWGIPPRGEVFTCQGNQPTDVTVRLAEPLGTRKVVQGATTFR
jgi:hypothetical protein